MEPEDLVDIITFAQNINSDTYYTVKRSACPVMVRLHRDELNSFNQLAGAGAWSMGRVRTTIGALANSPHCKHNCYAHFL